MNLHEIKVMYVKNKFTDFYKFFRKVDFSQK